MGLLAPFTGAGTANRSTSCIRPSPWSARAFDGPLHARRLQRDGLSLDAVSLEHGSGGDGDRYWMIYLNGAAGSIHRSRDREQVHQLHQAVPLERARLRRPPPRAEAAARRPEPRRRQPRTRGRWGRRSLLDDLPEWGCWLHSPEPVPRTGPPAAFARLQRVFV